MSRVHRLSLDGQRFGRWIVVSKHHKNERGEIYWLCKCDCGSEGVVQAKTLRVGQSTSCGCYHKEMISTHGMTKSRTWKSFDAMHQRCGNPKSPDYHRYGGRGITVSVEWDRFEAFLADMGERPPGKTLERNDVDSAYSKGNCRWATSSEQARNRRNTFRATMNGVTKSVSDWAEELRMPPNVIKWRLLNGWTDLLALTTPLAPTGPKRKATS